MKTGVKLIITVILTIGLALELKGQSERGLIIPNRFHGFTLGTPLSDFSQKSLMDSKNNPLILFSKIKTKSMIVYTLKNQLTEGGDKIDIDLFFYNDSLSVIRVGYKDKQTKKELLEAVKIKYGNDDWLEDNIYRDPLSGASRIIENLYWEKSACCILNLTSTDDIGLVYLTFAGKAAQLKLNDLELINKQRRIN